MLLGMDEYPYHQITATFAGVGGTDPAWNDGHYLCLSDMAGEVALASTLRLYQNNDVMDGFVCVRHAGKQHNIRVSRRLRPDMGTLAVGPLRLEIVEPLQSVRLVLEDNEHDISLDVTCRSTRAAVRGPGRSDARRRQADQRADHLRGDRQVRRVGAGRRRPRTSSTRQLDSFFRNHSWGYQAGRGGPRLYGAPLVGVQRRVPGVRQWVLFDMPDHGGFWFVDPSGRSASGKGAILYPDRSVPVVDVAHELEFYDGGRRLASGTVRLTDADGVVRDVHDRGPGLGVHPGRRILRRLRRRARPGRVSRRLPRRRRGLGRLPPDHHRRRRRQSLRVRSRMGRELHPADVRRRARAGALRVRRHSGSAGVDDPSRQSVDGRRCDERRGESRSAT